MGVVAIIAEKELECEINKKIKTEMEGNVVISGFGSSDCRMNCDRHLVFSYDSRIEFSIMRLLDVYSKDFSKSPLVFVTFECRNRVLLNRMRILTEKPFL
jgi:Uri superfamily endonuclease